MKVIGITGGIGSGKSTIAGFLAGMGAAVIDADEVGHEVLESEDEAKRQVIDAFGQGIVATDGRIDRKKLGSVVFGNAEALSRLNRIIYPRIDKVVEARLKRCRRQGMGVVFIDAPLLVEAGWGDKVDRIWVTTAPEAVILRRLEQSGLSRNEAMARINSQLSDEERRKHADVVINTDRSLDELEAKVAGLWREI